MQEGYHPFPEQSQSNYHHQTTNKNLMATVVDLINCVVELILNSIVRPFLTLHSAVYGRFLQPWLAQVVHDHGSTTQVFSSSVTAVHVTYTGAAVGVLTTVLLSAGHVWWPAILTVVVDLSHVLNRVLVDQVWEKEEHAAHSEDDDQNKSVAYHKDLVDKDSFEVVTTGSAHPVPSWTSLQRSRLYGAFVNSVSDKAFVIPCWISLLHIIPTSGYFKILQYFTLLTLILAETASACLLFKSHFSAAGLPPAHHPKDLSSLLFPETSAVPAHDMEQAKQALEMLGTALYMIPLTRYMGLALLVAAAPIAYESVRRTLQPRVIYVNYGGIGDVAGGGGHLLDHKILRFWMQVKALGCTKLIVGVPAMSGSGSSSGGKQQQQHQATTNDRVLNACACSAVDLVIAGAPVKADLLFLEKQGIDYCVVQAQNQTKLVTDEVINAKRCFVMGVDGSLQLVGSTVEGKEN